MTKAQKDVRFQHRSNTANGKNSRSSSGSSNDSAASDMASGQSSPAIAGNGKVKEPAQSANQSAEDYEKKKQSIITRTIWTLIMIAGFFICLFAGHLYIIMCLTAVQIISFQEVIAISNVPSRARSLRFTKTLNWYFLGTTMYFLYGESVVYYFKHILLVDRVLLPFATHHRFISFMLYLIGFVFFVTSLQKGHYRFQFTQFAWTHMALYLIVVQAHFVMNNIFEGMFWFFIPVTLVVTNDIWAYICGMTFGRTPLIKLSPKKTVEGFVGAWIFTIFFGFVFTKLMMQSPYFICPVNDLGANIFTGLKCQPNPVFLPHAYHIPSFSEFFPRLPFFLPKLPLPDTVTFAPIHLHVLVFATFASLIAPFGGFFASGLKRTFNVKDFGDSIPGHGGMTDRMDCQFIMGFFAFMYYQSFIAEYKTTVGAVIETAITGLSFEDQIEVVKSLSKHLVNQGIISPAVLESISHQLQKR